MARPTTPTNHNEDWQASDDPPVVGRDRGTRGGRIHGRVARIVGARGFGFIDGDDDVEYFMHKSSVGSVFDSFTEGTRVVFATMHTTKGWRAIDVVREDGEEG